MSMIIEDTGELEPIIVDSNLFQLRRFEDHAVLIRKSDQSAALFVGEDCILWDIQLSLARRRSHRDHDEFEREFDSVCKDLSAFGIRDDPWHLLPRGWETHGFFVSRPSVHATIFPSL